MCAAYTQVHPLTKIRLWPAAPHGYRYAPSSPVGGHISVARFGDVSPVKGSGARAVQTVPVSVRTRSFARRPCLNMPDARKLACIMCRSGQCSAFLSHGHTAHGSVSSSTHAHAYVRPQAFNLSSSAPATNNVETEISNLRAKTAMLDASTRARRRLRVQVCVVHPRPLFRCRTHTPSCQNSHATRCFHARTPPPPSAGLFCPSLASVSLSHTHTHTCVHPLPRLPSSHLLACVNKTRERTKKFTSPHLLCWVQRGIVSQFQPLSAPKRKLAALRLAL